MAEMKGIKLCGECANYDWKKHKCKIGCCDDSNAQAAFYGDCPLPDVVPKSKYDLAVAEREANVKGFAEELAKVRAETAREIFAELESVLSRVAYPSLTALGNIKVITAEGWHIRPDDYSTIKKKYTGN